LFGVFLEDSCVCGFGVMCVLISLAVITAKSSKLVQESKQQLRGDEQTLEGGAEKVNQRQPPHRGGIPGAM
jgi:hypothetical protein